MYTCLRLQDLIRCGRVEKSGKYLSIPPNGFSFGHCKILAYSIQCSGSLGIDAMVHMGKLICVLLEKRKRKKVKHKSILSSTRRTWLPRKHLHVTCFSVGGALFFAYLVNFCLWPKSFIFSPNTNSCCCRWKCETSPSVHHRCSLSPKTQAEQ